jgi:hypothetical protein
MRARFRGLVDNYVRHSIPLRNPALTNLALHVLDRDFISILNHTADVDTINEFFVFFLQVRLLCILNISCLQPLELLGAWIGLQRRDTFNRLSLQKLNLVNELALNFELGLCRQLRFGMDCFH